MPSFTRWYPRTHRKWLTQPSGRGSWQIKVTALRYVPILVSGQSRTEALFYPALQDKWRPLSAQRGTGLQQAQKLGDWGPRLRLLFSLHELWGALKEKACVDSSPASNLSENGASEASNMWSLSLLTFYSHLAKKKKNPIRRWWGKCANLAGLEKPRNQGHHCVSVSPLGFLSQGSPPVAGRALSLAIW